MNSKITHLGSQVNLLGNSASSSSIERFSSDIQITSETPETFIVHASDDTVVSAKNSLNYYQGLIQHHVPVELHLYEKGGHGFGLGRNETSRFWTTDCHNWMKSHNYITQ